MPGIRLIRRCTVARAGLRFRPSPVTATCGATEGQGERETYEPKISLPSLSPSVARLRRSHQHVTPRSEPWQPPEPPAVTGVHRTGRRAADARRHVADL